MKCILNLNFFVLLIVCIFSKNAFADPEKICEDLQKFVCAPGIYDDGTGSASNPTTRFGGPTAIGAQILKNAHDGFINILKNPDNTYFRKSVLSATGLSLSPKCKGGEDKPSVTCLEDMANGMTDIFAKQQSSSGQSYAGMELQGNPSVSDLTLVTDSPFYKQVATSVLSQAQTLIKSDEIDKKAREKVFPQIRAMLLGKINEMITDPILRKNLTDKVKAIRYVGSDCSKETGSNEATVPGLLLANAFYNPSQNTFKYCSGLDTQNSSEFHMAFIMAHELSHSIDPCNIATGPSDFAFKYSKDATRHKAENEYPFKGLISCLRSDKSARAKSADQMQMTSGAYGNYANYGGYAGYGTSTAQPGGAPATPPFAGFCQNDQITETFSDWMASEITPEYIDKNFPKLTTEQKRYGYSNIWRGMCVDEAQQLMMSMGQPDKHPTQSDRSNRIILTQPKIRQQMGCSKTLSDRKYCAVGATENAPTNSQVAPQGAVQ